MRDSLKKSVVKTVSWRFFAMLGTIIVVFIFTGKLTISIGVGLVDGMVKTLMYFAHERLWQRTW